jgi:uncharacterized repeat protein (TIGR01451 family)
MRLVTLSTVLAATAAFAATPGVASASLTISNATIDGVTSTSAPPGSVLGAKVTGTASGGDAWEGTAYRFGSGSPVCVNTPDTSGSRTVDFDVTAPGQPRSYNVGFTARGTNSCGGASSNEKVLPAALRVTTPAPNRDLPPLCGINVMLVLDKSGSIASSGQTETVKNATRAFLNALAGTGAKVSIVDFSTTAAQPVPYTTVTSDTIASTFNPYLANGYKPSGYTNWQAAFERVAAANTQGTKADLVVFITDGDPTARNTSTGTQTGLTEGAVAAMRPAAEAADLVKDPAQGEGSHVFALGVGSAVTTEGSARRLTAISGFDQYPDAPFGEADYTLVQDFDALAESLRQIVLELCKSSVTVTKLVDEGDGVYRADAGWNMTASIDTTPGSFSWLKPPASGTGPQSQSTDDDGIATFQWKPDNADATSAVSITEAVNPGFDFVDAQCVLNTIRRGNRAARRVEFTQPTFGVTVGPGQYATCTVRNRVRVGTIEIEKRATPQDLQAFSFVGSFGPFALIDDEKGTAPSKIFSGLTPGTYAVSELVPQNWQLTGITCIPSSAGVVDGAQVTITLAPESSVVCTYADLRTEPPTPTPTPSPEPGPEPTPPPSPSPPEASTEPPPTQLQVVKTMRRVARVGSRVRFALTVRNVGTVAATGVQVADVPPASVRLAALRTTGDFRFVRGNAVWRVGTLAPGASRTVTGSVRITSAAPGLKRNLAVAAAVNASVVIDPADVRVLRARRASSPSFTG